jgi:ADP-ribose pyrophosphatase
MTGADDHSKPEGTKLGYKRLGTTFPFSTKWLRLRQDRIRLPGDKEIDFSYIDRSFAVEIVPVMPSGEIVLTWQYRYPVDEWCYGVPAGGTHDRGDDALEDVARDELHEEVGASCDELVQVNYFYASVGRSAETCYVFLALGVRLDSEPTLEETEHIEARPVPAKEALHMARSGEIKDGMSALSILICEDLLKQHGYV